MPGVLFDTSGGSGWLDSLSDTTGASCAGIVASEGQNVIQGLIQLVRHVGGQVVLFGGIRGEYWAWVMAFEKYLSNV